jgi:hypothetical protein
MIVTHENIWQGYVRLHRYCQAVGVSDKSKIKLPKTIHNKLPPPYYLVCEEAANLLNSLDKDMPVPFGAEYYSYIFLFRQLVRVSYQSGPYYHSGEQGWRNLAWATPTMLLNKENAEREWVAFYKRNFLGNKTTINQADFYVLYPPLEAEEIFQFKVASSQVSQFFLVLRARKNNYYNALLEDSSETWHPWIYFACPEFWGNYELLKDKLNYFGPLLKDQRMWKVFVHQFLPLVYEKDLPKVKNRLAWAIDNVIKGQSREARAAWNKYASKVLLKNV